jgi:hypothetical protein
MQNNLDRLSLTFGRKVIGIHNKTSGIIFDVLECLIQRNFGFAANDIRSGYRVLKSTLYEPEVTKVVFVLHSQGGIEGGMIIDWLLQEVPTDLMRKLEVYTFGCAANHFNNPHTLRASLTTAKEAKNRRERIRGNGKAIRYIEHYANSEDFVALFGVLNYTTRAVSTSAATAPRFMGRVFERQGKGHQFIQHYLDNMFPYDFETKRALDDCEFMDLDIRIGDQNQTSIASNGDASRENVIQSVARLDGGSDDEQQSTLVCEQDPSTPQIERDWFGINRGTSYDTKVKHMSRLWLYRNGASPPPDSVNS